MLTQMRQRGRAKAAFVLAAICFAGEAAALQRADLERITAQAENEFRTREDQARMRYGRALSAAADRAATAGQLAELLEAKRERERFLSELTVPATGQDGLPDSLVQARREYRAAVDAARLRSARRISDAAERVRRRQLREAQRLLAAGRLPAAMAARDAVDATDFWAPVVRARFDLATEDSILSNRRPDRRAVALEMYGGGARTEQAVLRALRWLTAVQEPDGSWLRGSGTPEEEAPAPAYASAMTALALLAYLGRGETPASPEFGEAVRKGLERLVANQEADGRFRYRSSKNYTQAIAACALCEAYALTGISRIGAAAEKAVAVILEGQRRDGTWNYNFDDRPRNDTSFMGWCLQALKAARTAELRNPGLNRAIRRGRKAMRRQSQPGGGFGYLHPGQTPLTGTGVLCLQQLGNRRRREVRYGLFWLQQNASFRWSQPWGQWPVSSWYHATYAKFNAGGEYWVAWRSPMIRELTRNQQAADAAGTSGDDAGFWDLSFGSEHYGRVYTTALCALQLEVFYRYLPTHERTW